MGVMNSNLGGPAGYGEGVFSNTVLVAGNTDDGSVFIDVSPVFGSEGLNFFDTSFTGLYVNSNGLITFESANTDYAGTGLSELTEPAIAPFWADHNVNSGGEIFWDVDPTAGTISLTWLDVAPYSGSGTNSYQVVISNTGDGNFDIQFVYEDINWSGGVGQGAVTGITDGGFHNYPMEGSQNSNALNGYENNNFEDGNAPGVYDVSVVNGFPSNPDGAVDGSDGNDSFILSILDLAGDAITTGADTILAGGGMISSMRMQVTTLFMVDQGPIPSLAALAMTLSRGRRTRR